MTPFVARSRKLEKVHIGVATRLQCTRLKMHCSTHNIDYQCPACRAEEEAEYQRMMLELQRQAKAELQAQRRHVEILEIQRDEIDQRQSLGRYDCPFCLYRELKRG